MVYDPRRLALMLYATGFTALACNGVAAQSYGNFGAKLAQPIACKVAPLVWKDVLVAGTV